MIYFFGFINISAKITSWKSFENTQKKKQFRFFLSGTEIAAKNTRRDQIGHLCVFVNGLLGKTVNQRNLITTTSSFKIINFYFHFFSLSLSLSQVLIIRIGDLHNLSPI